MNKEHKEGITEVVMTILGISAILLVVLMFRGDIPYELYYAE